MTVKLNLLRLCNEKTILKLLIHERAEDQLSLDRVLDTTIEFYYRTTHVNKTELNTAIMLVPP